ncbi:ABC transporter permease [uncultured Tolumonas sp.]|uniref:ABC transporter permease n=1 Tax=uncultured Tolumonas sp. TaxID=263765 RepID=UPI0029303CB7|nr:ABC transporter permease [uncultured Tolumonas sp.]
MAKTLRFALMHAWRDQLMFGLTIVLVALIFMPLIPGLFWAMSPAFHLSVWRTLWLDPQWKPALLATVLSAVIGTMLAFLFAISMAMQLYPGRRWLQLRQRLPILLAIPHAAFAVGFFFLVAPSGWLSRLVALLSGWVMPPNWVTVQDAYGLSLALALAIKESWFLLWVLFAVLSEQEITRQMTLGQTLGYSRTQVWRAILLPQILPRMGWPLAAVLAYGLSVVDMALILGPTNPPTLAVLIWQWLTNPDEKLQAQGSAASLLLLGLLLMMVALIRFVWQQGLHFRRYPLGERFPKQRSRVPCLHLLFFGVGYAVIFLLLLWSLAGGWFYPAIWPETITLTSWLQADFAPFQTSLWLGFAVCFLCLPLVLFWLEWGPQKLNALLYLPLIVPALPLMAGQYSALLHLHLDGSAMGLIWSHLLWVLPYMLLTLVGPYRAFDRRIMTTTQALGVSRFMACLRVKWPMLLRPIMAALAIGFAVSIAQYLPTLFAGGGRFDTVTTEAVALSAGGNRRILAVQALLQILLPLMAFACAAWLPTWLFRHRKGLH